MEFEITAPDGRTLSIEGDSMPNEQELEDIFANVKSDFNSGKAKTSDIYSVDGLPSDTPSKLMQVGEFLKEGVAKPVAQGYFNLAKGFGGMMNWYADQSRLSKEDAESLDISEDVRQKLNTFSDILNIAGDSVRYGSEEWLEKEWLKSDPEVFKGEFFENPSWTRASAAVASALPSFTSIVAFGKSNFALGYALMAGSENADIYLEAKEKVGEEKASGLFLAGTAGTAAIDIAMKPIEKIIKPLKGGFINRMAERAIRGGMEALPESLQQVYQNAVKKYGYDATQSLWSGVIESAIGGFGMGAVAAGAEGLIEQGATEEEVEQLQNVAVESIIANSKELNDIAYQDMKKTLTKINEKFANMSEDDVMRIGRELEEGFGKYYRELSQIMPEEQARSNAALIRNHAFFASDAMGISPKEYFDKYAPKIEKTAFSEFGKPKQEAKPYVLSEEELKGVEAPHMTQQDINYAKSHPEWKKNADNIELIERAGASINDDLETINNALRNYATEDYRYRREQEVNHYNALASQLNEDEQERFAIMVENGTNADEAFNQIKGIESDTEGLDLTPRQDTYTRVFGANGQVSYFQDQIKEAQDLSENMEKLDNIYPAYDGETINIDGVERTVYNSNGDRIAKSKEALENFYRWFGDSKVVDEQGRPLVVYHGTDVEFSVFDKTKADSSVGLPAFYFSSSEQYSREYGNIIMPVYLKAENVFDIGKDIPDGWYELKTNEERVDLLKKQGYDGVFDYNAGATEYAVFNPNQIKSTSNRGTYSESENIYYQDGDDRDLVVLHSISPANLRKSIEFGGFAVPSLAIVRKGQEFHFDNLPITLVGNKQMIDPYDERNEVYNRDVWTKTFPYVTYKKPTQAKEKSFKNKIGEYYKRTNSENELGSFIYVAQRGDTSSALSQFESSTGAILYYLENIKKQKVEFAEKDLASDILQRYGIDETLANEIQGLDANTDKEKITKAFKEFLERKHEEDFANIEDAEKREKMINFSRKLENKNYFDNDGIIYFGKADTIVNAAGNYFRSKGKKFIDQYDVRSQLREMVKDDEDYQEWATDFFENELVGDKMVQVGNTLKPFTLDNVVAAMTSGKTIASQATPLPAIGKVIAQGAKKLESIRDIKEEGKRLVTDEQSRENMEKVTEALYEFLNMFDKDTSFEINMDRKDAVAQALQDVLKNKNVTKESLKKAILRNLPSEKTVSDEALSYGVELAKQIKDLARYYFEAKPQRAVGLNEFSAAIVPTDAQFDEIANFVSSKGLDVVRSDNQQEALQNIDVNKNVFFQDEQAPRGAFANDTIYLFENANESTLPHELTHSWQKELRRINETNPTEKLTGMLEQIDNWTSSEFTRKYSVSKRNYGYAVIDKRGNVVYDNRGNGFLTEQDAVEYAKDEIFARGFEQYVREGKAPNNSLKQAFRNFFMWLKKIYRDAMDLNIQLSPDIKNVYADLLGGVDVDFFLDATPESFIQQRIKLGEQREKTLDGIIQDAQANKQRVVKTKRGKGFSRVWATAMIPLSTRAKRISPKLRNVLRKYEFTLSNELNKKYDKVRPFMDLWKNISEDDIIAFDFALKNDYVAKQLEIVDKYNARKEWEAVRETLENIYDDALNAGLDINWRPDYFPRKVKDVDGFLSYLHNAPEWTRFQQAISEAGLDGATAEEQAEFLNKYLRGFVKVDLMPNRYGSEKERKIDIIDNEMNQFYAPSIEALVGYIEGLNSRIVSSKFLGKGANIEESIGGYLTYLLNNNIIAPEQIDEARNILRARFDARGVSNPWLANMRNYSYMYTMGGINSAITQIEDLSVSMYKAGVWNTLTTAMESKRITKKDLGLDSISAEFVEQSKSASYLNKLFKLTGLDGIDSFGKETLVNAELKKFQKMSDETLREYIEPIMEEETNATIQDIRNNNISDNVLYLMFSELSDVQPISLSELPEFYNRGGNLRILYMLKSFALKRIDIFRNECVDKIKSKDFNQVKEGMQNLLKLSALMVICGTSKDWLIDLLYGRETDMSERVLNNILGLVGLSKFQIYQAKEKGFTGTVKDIVVPPLFAVFDDLFTDVAKGVQGKREIKDFEVWKGIPLVGRFYYWWVGRGSEKQKKNKKY